MPHSSPVILAFDTSAAHCAVALLSGDQIVAQCTENMRKGQAERLIPLAEELLQKANIAWDDLTAVGVGVGPGNFTGVRISVAAARGIALGRNVPAIGVTVFDALAHKTTGQICVTLDGRRDQIFWQNFDDGRAVGQPQVSQATDFETDRTVTGFLANEPFAVDPSAIAWLAKDRMQVETVLPAPLYLRPADAALPSEEPLVILP